MLKKEALKSIHISRELHKQLKIYMLVNDIKTMQELVEPALTNAITKPNAKDRLAKQRDELPQAVADEIDKEIEREKEKKVEQPKSESGIIQVLS